MPSYHDFVFDLAARKFVGNFEEMYQAEGSAGFDSWHQDDLQSRFDVQEMSRLIEGRHFGYLIDIGSGKGALTEHLSANATTSIGLDISQTAVDVATSRYPSIRFHSMDINDPNTLNMTLDNLITLKHHTSLVVLSQVLSYLSEWRTILKVVSEHASTLLVALYLPPDPIGYVKSSDELRIELERHGVVRYWQVSEDATQHVVMVDTTTGAQG